MGKTNRLLIKLVSFLLSLIIILTLIAGVCEVWNKPEKYSSMYRYQLMNDLERGSESATEYYYKNYILSHDYLFNGEITFRLVCERESITQKDCDSFYSQFVKSDLSLGKFEKKFMR